MTTTAPKPTPVLNYGLALAMMVPGLAFLFTAWPTRCPLVVSIPLALVGFALHMGVARSLTQDQRHVHAHPHLLTPDPVTIAKRVPHALNIALHVREGRGRLVVHNNGTSTFRLHVNVSTSAPQYLDADTTAAVHTLLNADDNTLQGLYR